MFKNLRVNLARLISPVRNSMNLANQFLRYGSKTSIGNWDEVSMTDRDMYTGYPYAAIRNRAATVARVASENLKTESNVDGLEHPYYKLIYDSEYYTEFAFWTMISTFLDLEGVYYIMAIRSESGTRYGNIKSFKLLNPYHIRRVLDPETLEVTGYVETRKGLVREIPASMIIEIRELNPFDQDEPMSMTDAAKESQFTLKSSSSYTRNVIKNNVNAPGILSTDVILSDPEFENFRSRVTNHTKGEPLFGNGTGAITWQSMISDLSKSALKEVNEVNRDLLLAVAGVSKTIVGIEQSGTTRETVKVQKDLYVEGQILPRIQLIIDSLNMDYRTHYLTDYAKTGAYLEIDNPQATDHDADQKDTDVKQSQFDLYQSLVEKGYPPAKAAKYVKGEITIADLGKPKAADVVVPPVDKTNQPDAAIPPAANSLKKKDHSHTHNALTEDQKTIVDRQQFYLKNAVINVDEQLVVEVIKKIEKKENSYEVISDLIGARDKNAITNQLEGVLQTFYGTTMASEGIEAMRRRTAEMLLNGTFSFDNMTKQYIKEISLKVSDSHVDTILSDLLVTTREAALEGLGQKEIVSKIKQKYTDTITKTRATAVARTETNRSFTRAQFEADRQLIEQNALEGKAYKRWRTRSDNPCPFCLSLEAEGEVPFTATFRELGTDIVVGEGKDKKTLPVNFESLEAGNAHTNCSCDYELIIRE